MAWRRPIQSVICAFLLLCVAVPVKTTENDAPHMVTKHFVYGKLDHKVKVYVKVLNNSPFLVCMDVDIAQKETIDPFYLWIGPDGRNLKAYREPDYMYQVNIRYRAKPCHHSANLQFIENLLRIITEIIASLNCQMKNTFHKCHVIKAPEHSLQNELFISFKVNPFPHSWEKECIGDCEEETNRHTLKARDVIEEFFKLQPRVLEEEFEDVPEINYIEHSLGIVRVDTCRPGFGKNEITHNDCSGCCVVCDPGTYSSDNSVRCEVCKDIQITYFGATAC
ncbi:zona pellucida-binding protein 2 isoform X3 [Mixophyes fleayi]|uniref:zona pellucida-binding protein 2 isoform X3 n=1 Tax=Mixophyes fleayi TaxID=3061075 RepID=UPI003F4E05E4